MPHYIHLGEGLQAVFLHLRARLCLGHAFREHLTLTLAAYPAAGGEPKSFRDAVDHWLLIECLSAIGSHSMI